MCSKHVVIGGGTGFIGRQLIDLLSLQRIPFTIISRKPGPNRISWVDLEEKGLPKETTTVINVAGQNVLDPLRRWTPEFQKIIKQSRIETTRTLTNVVKNCNVKCFITISGVAYYKPNDLIYTEESKCEAYDFLSELCHDWEAAAQLPTSCNTRQVIIRSGVVLGKNGGMIKQIYWPFFFGLGGPIGSGKQSMPWIHVSDLACMFFFAMQNDNVHGILNGVAPQIITNQEFTNEVAAAMRRPAFLPIPAIALKLIFGEERSRMMLEGQKVLPKRVQELGFKHCYPTIRSACKEIFG